MALYLKYRPQDFDSLIGQDFVKETLQSAVENSKTVWAYLLCWPRGTGKTTTARILTKALNCLELKKWNPCNNCDTCNGINNESLVDVIEIDAASHTGVDNIREIIEKAQFRPTIAKNKVYIIDEVHMLSKWAFNALLKILEEPPEYVVFILATTETHKVPDTIVSRCQRYDLKNITNEDIISRLTFVAKEENISIDSDSLKYIASNSWWALRNAISLFEQLNNNWKIVYAEIVEKLWIVEWGILNSFLHKLLEKDSSVIQDLEKLIADWKNVKLFFKQLLFFAKDYALGEVFNGKNVQDCITILDTLDDTYAKTKHSLDENITFTIGILKIISNYQSNNAIQNTSEDTKVVAPSEVKKISEAKIQPEKSSDVIGNSPVTKINSQELSTSDAEDIFWEVNITTPTSDNKKTTKDSNVAAWNSDFDMDWYIKTLKWLWAKAWITLSLKWANYSLAWNELCLSFKTKFAFNSMNNTDNIALLNKWLEDMWLADKKIHLEW